MGYSQLIRVIAPTYQDPLTCPIDEETTAEDVIIDLCKRLNIKPVARHLFALRLHNTKAWVSLISKLVSSESKVYELRIRFKIPVFGKLNLIDPVSYNFYFHQVRQDLLSNLVSGIDHSKIEAELLGMGVADMCIEILETGATKEKVLKSYKKFIPTAVYKSHFFFLKRPLQKSLNAMIDSLSKQGNPEASYVKKQYLKQFENLAPNYLCEEYKALIDEGGSWKSINIQVNPFDMEFPGIKFCYDGQTKWHHMCTIEELCFITEREEDGGVLIGRRSGIPIYLTLRPTTSMVSLVTLLDGYYRLGAKWMFSLSIDTPTPSLNRLRALKCHGPVGGEFSYGKLEKQLSTKRGSYILRESELAYDQYYLDVCVRNSSKPITFKIEKSLTGEGWLFNSEEPHYSSLKELLKALRSPDSPVQLSQCLPPSENDVSPLLLCKVENYKQDDEDVGLSSASSGVTQFIDPKELLLVKGNNKEHKGRISVVYRGEWHPGMIKKATKKKIKIALKVLKSDNHSLEDHLELMGGWASVQSSALVRLFGLTLKSPRGFVMELLELGPLDVYLHQYGQQVKEVDLIEAAKHLVTALWDLEEAKLVHGNVRCHKLLVAAHTDSSFVVRLTDPGLSRTYTNNDFHWVAPEHHWANNSSTKSQAADMWAFGTTLWELFSKGKVPSANDMEVSQKLLEENNLKKMYQAGARLRNPVDCPPDILSLMQHCWSADLPSRTKTQEALRDINKLLYQEFNSRRNHYTAIKPNDLHRTTMNGPYNSTSSSHFTSDSGCSKTTEDWSEASSATCTSQDDICPMESSCSQEMNTESTQVDTLSSIQCIFEVEADYRVVLQGRIGQGFYGEVYRGTLEQMDGDGESQLVAIKKLKENTINTALQDFEREIVIMKQLQHENIVKIIAVVSDPDFSLVMEFIPRGPLESYLRIHKDQLGEIHLLKFALDVAKGMEYLGSMNIVHRDLATRNILVVNETSVKISDFGLAQIVGANDYYISQNYERKLPFKWYAPESLIYGKYSTKSDVWSYGVTLFEMFSFGEDPEFAELKQCSVESLIPKQVEILNSGKRLPLPTKCPVEVYLQLMHPCWNINSHERPTFKKICSIVAKIWEHVC